MNKVLVFLICCLFVLCGCSNNKFNNSVVDYTKAKELILNGAVLIDVRSFEEYDMGHIDGAVSLPVDMINEDTILDVVSSKEDSIIVYCRSGSRSNQAFNILKNMGYKNVYDLGSISNWKE